MDLIKENRDHILIYLNGHRHEVKGEQAFMTLSDFLRYQKNLTGTKVVCAEGDCGACTVLVAAVTPGQSFESLQYKPINACIQFIHGLDCCHIITVEGMTENDVLHPIQESMIQAQGTQCGFCTPGFVMAIAGMLENPNDESCISVQKAKNHLTGNLCRCTGYQQIINACTQLNTANYQTIKSRYHNKQLHQHLLDATQKGVYIESETNSFYSPINLEQATKSMQLHKKQIFAASTDLGVQYNKGHFHEQQVIGLNLISELHHIQVNADRVKIGARVTLSQLEDNLQNIFPEWMEFLHVFASPQIKNNGTLVGNVANGSPIGDNLPFLLAMDANLWLQGTQTKRSININNFYLGYKQLDLAADEIITHVEIPIPESKPFIKLYKVSQRRDLDISCVAATMMISMDDEQKVKKAKMAFGGVAATPIRLSQIENELYGKSFSEISESTHIQSVAELIATSIKPQSDVRGSEEFRRVLAGNLYRKFMLAYKKSQEVVHAI